MMIASLPHDLMVRATFFSSKAMSTTAEVFEKGGTRLALLDEYGRIRPSTHMGAIIFMVLVSQVLLLRRGQGILAGSRPQIWL